MTRCLRRAALAALLFCLPVAALAALEPEDIVDRYGGAVVLLRLTSESGTRSIGTGFFVASDGLLITSLHVLRGAVRGEVQTTAGATFEAPEVVAYDAVQDLAALRVHGAELPTVTCGDSRDRLGSAPGST